MNSFDLSFTFIGGVAKIVATHYCGGIYTFYKFGNLLAINKSDLLACATGNSKPGNIEPWRNSPCDEFDVILHSMLFKTDSIQGCDHTCIDLTTEA
jgi:hypothetical protein